MIPHSNSVHRFESWGALETTLLWVKEITQDDDAPATTYPSYPSLALFVIEGSVVFHFGKVEEAYQAGTWIFPRKEIGSYIPAQGSRMLVIRFFVKWPNGTPLFNNEKTTHFTQAAAPPLAKNANALASYIRKHKMLSMQQGVPRLNGTMENYILLQARFADWVAAYYTTFAKHGHEPTRFQPMSSRVRECLRYLRSRSLASPFHERELADETGLSLSQICKIFVQEIGVTPQSYWNSRRLAAAQLDLTDVEKSIKEVAYNLGFSSQGHFSFWFQKQMGVSPRAFRTREMQAVAR